MPQRTLSCALATMYKSMALVTTIVKDIGKKKRSYIYGHFVKHEIIYIENPCCVEMKQLKICSQDVTLFSLA